MGDAPNRLRALREQAGLTQQDVADRISALDSRRVPTASTVSRWERGEVAPGLPYRRLLAEVLGVTIEALEISAPLSRPLVDEFAAEVDVRVAESQDRWRRTRQALNVSRHQLAQAAAALYPDARLGSTGLITGPGWLPDAPVDLATIRLVEDPHAAPPVMDGTESETGLVRPQQTLVRQYSRYTHAIRDLARPRLFENRLSWRLLDVDWSNGGRLGFGDTTYFEATDVFESLAHELAYVGLDEGGSLVRPRLALRDLPYRRRIGSPFDLSRRPVLGAISTLTVRRSPDGSAEFLLHRRDPRSVTAAGGMLQVIPSGIFQPSSPMPAARLADFDLWRNVQREFFEELAGLPEAGGDGRPVDYASEPFAGLDRARAEGRLRVYCLGVALDALTLFGEIMTVLVLDSDVFDDLAADFVEANDEGRVVAERFAFDEGTIRGLLDGGRLAPAGAGCVELAWRWRDRLLG
ncbi:helix-turn-helix transcriptional regulator [Polymorphospora lycopeni]|uniref:Helix-turn-helix transcriptional regulator n=1 Tax=Polymorphospora lycopeni TaxID=3140240 RepID=A0ABV5CKZ3_9ACTN